MISWSPCIWNYGKSCQSCSSTSTGTRDWRKGSKSWSSLAPLRLSAAGSNSSLMLRATARISWRKVFVFQLFQPRWQKRSQRSWRRGLKAVSGCQPKAPSTRTTIKQKSDEELCDLNFIPTTSPTTWFRFSISVTASSASAFTWEKSIDLFRLQKNLHLWLVWPGGRPPQLCSGQRCQSQEDRRWLDLRH